MRRDEFRPDEDPLRPVLCAIIVAIVLVGAVLLLSACATPERSGGFPPDMTLVCHRGMAFIVSDEAQQVLALPFHCQSV